MPSRSTLPDTDPLAQLGIGVTPLAPRESAFARRRKKQQPRHPAEAESSHSSLQPKVQPRSRDLERRAAGHAAGVSGKQKLNCRIPAELADSIRDCVVALSGPPDGLTVDAFAEEAFRCELERLRRSRNAGEPFAKRPYGPKPGRRVS